MKICLLSLSGLTFDVTTPEHTPLGGTESCFCYLARELAKTHEVTLVSRNVPDATLMNVRHSNEMLAHEYDVVISNAPIEFTGNGKKPYYIFWNHLAHFDAAVKGLLFRDVMEGIDCIVYVSQWQKNECEKWFGKAKKTVMIGNGLTPSFENMFESADEMVVYKTLAKVPTAVYTSTPYRGLRMLPQVMDGLRGIRLEVYSGLTVYQGDDTGYQGVYDSLRRPDTTYVGNVSQVELAWRLRGASFMFYPCVFPETFCIAALEAMAAGLEVVTSNIGALPETLAGHGWMVDDCQLSLDAFVERFCHAINAAKASQADRDEHAARKWAQVQYVNENCTWRVRAKEWERLFAEMGDEPL